jgi:putative membrane protein
MSFRYSRRLAFLATAAISTSVFAAPKSDDAFLGEAIQGDLAEIQMGKLAMSKGQDEDVKDFGETLSNDHSKALQEASALAKRLGVAAPTAPKPDAQQMYEMLSKLSGTEFDRQFVAHMIAAHRKEIAAFSEQTKGGKDSDVTKLAVKTLPILEKHLEIAQGALQ